MSEGTFTDHRVHAWLQEIADDGWVSLHFDSPALDGVGGSEISGGGYLRTKVLFTPPTNRTIWSEQDAKWTGLNETTISHFGIWSAQTQGVLHAYGSLPTKALVLTGRGFVIKAGQLALSIS